MLFCLVFGNASNCRDPFKRISRTGRCHSKIEEGEFIFEYWVESKNDREEC